ncbi:hypothetical protein FOZ62_001540 [Perkinsus olseni]|uniref:Uncharacterized protein n=1 Tax=Perkinsus olseni TaxID=32597 RepID=A0A7J6TAF9_PEROL|nr:hypothetical protein FOZ62_001540 [Perkinsus olseni]
MSNNGEATTGAQTPREPPETSTTSPTSLKKLIKYLERQNFDYLHNENTPTSPLNYLQVYTDDDLNYITDVKISDYTKLPTTTTTDAYTINYPTWTYQLHYLYLPYL